ncbi:MAG: branched-chain amino acid aminotransferase [Planctomycetia bacterium]|nr:branched-chain amino acid aminotransferase [Planctomycetia bacterium]
MKTFCTSLIARFYRDEAGFIVSAELVLVSTITVLALVVGLSEVAYGINGELEDVGAAFGSLNQSFCISGMQNNKGSKWHGSHFGDQVDLCDGQNDIRSTAPSSEQGGGQGQW